ncbi:MAG: restriction endonuclease subunit S [Ignavibacterium sp.]|nr:restriction endonuclease subunit S [Ignavibacterium sp.]
MKLEEIFNIYNGISSDKVIIKSIKTDEYSVPYLRPSNNFSNVIAGYVDPSEIPEKYLFGPEEIFVSTDGQGSHTYSYVSTCVFVPNSNVAVLIPKKDMKLQEKIYYANCITLNRYRFSYGRKPKGERLASLILPSAVPQDIANAKVDFGNDLSKPFMVHPRTGLKTSNWKWFKYSELFIIDRGRGARLNELLNEGSTPVITSTDRNNGLSGFINRSAYHSGNVISVARNGSVGEAFYQPIPFCSTEDVHIFTPKFELNIFRAMFFITIIRMEKYRFNYGRKWGLSRMRNSLIKLPVTNSGTPDFQSMERIIKSLSYSSQLL